MPLIKNYVASEEIEAAGTKTMILDIKTTRELELSSKSLTKTISYEEIIDLRQRFGSIEVFNEILTRAEGEFEGLEEVIESVETFYEIVWRRTKLELLFIMKYFTNELQKPLAFEQIHKMNDSFNAWFTSNVKYTTITRLRQFYLRTAKKYAEIAIIDIYETDIEAKAKEASQNIDEAYLDDYKEYLEYEFNNALEHHENVYKPAQQKKRDSILFE